MRENKKIASGFTLIELLIVIAIIGILAAMILVGTTNVKNRARVNNELISLRSTLAIIVTCNDANTPVNAPSGGTPPGGNPICSSAATSLWPTLDWGFSYIPIGSTGGNYGTNCLFDVDTNGSRTTDIRCDCSRQVCE